MNRSTLDITLDRLAREHRRLVRLERTTARLRWWLVGLMLAVLIDAGWSLLGAAFTADDQVLYDLPAPWRAILAGLLLVGLAAVAAAWRLPASVRRMSRADYARHAERLAGLGGNPLVNAVQLDRPHWPDELAGALARRAVEKGCRIAEQQDPATLLDRGPLRRQARRLVALAAALAGLAALMMVGLAPSAPLLALLRLVDPTGDHPPLSRHVWQVAYQPRPLGIGQSLQVSVAVNRRPLAPPRLVLLDRTGQPLARLAMSARSDSSADRNGPWLIKLPNVQQSVHFMIVGSHSRSPVYHVRPVPLPRILTVEAKMQLPTGQAPVPVPLVPGKAILGPVGATLHLEVTSDRPDAVLDHPRASGLELDLPLTAGSQTVELALVSPEGWPSPQKMQVTVIGLSGRKLAQWLEQQASPTSPAGIAAHLPDGQPAEPATPALTARQDNPSSQSAARSTGSPTGHDPLTTGSGGDQPGQAGRPDPLASGLAVASVLVDPALPVQVRQQADRAPAAYRELVAEYFLRISRPEAPASPQPPRGDHP